MDIQSSPTGEHLEETYVTVFEVHMTTSGDTTVPSLPHTHSVFLCLSFFLILSLSHIHIYT